MRKRWIQVRTENGPELVPADEYTGARKGPFVMGDIEPYKAITGDMEGKWITSRSKHKDYLRRNGLVEVGNEKTYFTKYGGMSPDNPNLVSDRKREEQICQNLTQNIQKLRSR